MTEQPKRRSYKETMRGLTEEDVWVIEAEMARKNTRIAELEQINNALGVIIGEYYDNIRVLSANSERMIAPLKQVKQT